eukprot:gene361-682_t
MASIAPHGPVTPITVGRDIYNCLLLSYIVGEATLRKRSIESLKLPIVLFVVPNTIAGIAYFISDATADVKEEVWEVVTHVKVPLIVISFFLLTYWDINRERKMTFKGFCYETFLALKLMCPVIPVLIVMFSLFFFIMTSIPRRLGAPEKMINNVIYYGQFYGPFSILYLMLKRQFLMEPVLPTQIAPSNEGQSMMGRGTQFTVF